jgi:hypothetical protein
MLIPVLGFFPGILPGILPRKIQEDPGNSRKKIFLNNLKKFNIYYVLFYKLHFIISFLQYSMN